MSVIEIDDQEPQEMKPPRRMATWHVIAFAIVIGIAYLIGNSVAAAIIVATKVAKNPQFDVDQWVLGAESDGQVIAFCTICGAGFLLTVMALCVRFQKQVSAAEYVGLRAVSPRNCLLWVASMLMLLIALDGITALLGNETIPDWMVRIYSSEYAVPWLWIALVIAAPIAEEFYFRGFLFTGLSASSLGVVGTCVVTSLLWAVIHTQYDMYIVGMIFVEGLVLGYARVRTGSIVPCILMHAAANLMATIQVALHAG